MTEVVNACETVACDTSAMWATSIDVTRLRCWQFGPLISSL
jgi:hypothetical protein